MQYYTTCIGEAGNGVGNGWTLYLDIGNSLVWKFWTKDECLYKSDNWDLLIVKLVGKICQS